LAFAGWDSGDGFLDPQFDQHRRAVIATTPLPFSCASRSAAPGRSRSPRRCPLPSIPPHLRNLAFFSRVARGDLNRPAWLAPLWQGKSLALGENHDA
jgi:hypothetical protein